MDQYLKIVVFFYILAVNNVNFSRTKTKSAEVTRMFRVNSVDLVLVREKFKSLTAKIKKTTILMYC